MIVFGIISRIGDDAIPLHVASGLPKSDRELGRNL